MSNIFLAIAIGCLLFAALNDAFYRRIPNFIVASIFVLGCVYKIHAGHYCYFVVDFVPFFVILLVGLVAFQCRVLAGGDVKLLSVSGYLVGIQDWLVLCLWTTVFGGVLALIILVWRLFAVLWGVVFGQRKRHPGLRQIELPYGVAIAAAAILLMAQQRAAGAVGVSP